MPRLLGCSANFSEAKAEESSDISVEIQPFFNLHEIVAECKVFNLRFVLAHKLGNSSRKIS
jgi:hypothetical protein